MRPTKPDTGPFECGTPSPACLCILPHLSPVFCPDFGTHFSGSHVTGQFGSGMVRACFVNNPNLDRIESERPNLLKQVH